jgi:hypothetical protein
VRRDWWFGFGAPHHRVCVVLVGALTSGNAQALWVHHQSSPWPVSSAQCSRCNLLTLPDGGSKEKVACFYRGEEQQEQPERTTLSTPKKKEKKKKRKKKKKSVDFDTFFIKLFDINYQKKHMKNCNCQKLMRKDRC